VDDALALLPQAQEHVQGETLGNAYLQRVLRGDAVDGRHVVEDRPAFGVHDHVHAGDFLAGVEVHQDSGELHDVRLGGMLG